MKQLGYEFRDGGLLQEALTHSSYANEHRKLGLRCNERLEFLGDAVLNMIVAQSIFKQFPDMPDGQMTKLRAELVCEKNRVTVAEKLALGSMMRLGRGESRAGAEAPSILADSVEAVLAAVFLTEDWKARKRWSTNTF
jgi:ribonuclease-3